MVKETDIESIRSLDALDRLLGLSTSVDYLEQLAPALREVFLADVTLIGVQSEDSQYLDLTLTTHSGERRLTKVSASSLTNCIRLESGRSTLEWEELKRLLHGWPDEERLIEFIGLPIFDSCSNVIGLLALSSYRERILPESAHHTLQRLSNRVAVEILRTVRDRTEEIVSDKLDLVLEASGAILLEHDFAKKQVSASNQFWSLLGYPNEPQYLDVSRLRSIIHPEDRVTPQSFDSIRIKNSNGFRNQVRLKTYQGKYKWFEYRGVTEHGENGDILRSKGILIEVTDLKTIENNLKEINFRYELALSSMSAGIWDVNLETDEKYASERLCELLGLDSGEDLVRGFLLSRIHPEDSDRHAAVEMSVSGASQYESEYRIRGANGDYIWIRNCAFVERSESGKPIRLTGFIEDITERKLQSIALETALVDAESADRAKSNFLSVISHEIRTPMNGVLGMAKLLDKTDLSDQQKDYLSVVIESAQSLLELLNDLLDAIKLDDGRLKVDKREFELSSILRKSQMLWGPLFEQKGVWFLIENEYCGPDLLLGDPVRISQIVNNLLSNALKFTEKGKVVLRVESKISNEGASFLVFEVKDTGIGIDEEHQHKLFHRFYQVDSSHTRQVGGSGLGLSICKDLVDIMGGQVGVESVESIGSTFWFSVPLSMAVSTDVELKMVETKMQEDLESVPTAKLKVLVAEDNLMNQKVMASILKVAGVDTDIASDGCEAVEMAERKEYDIIFMDIQMPILGGQEATQEIRMISPHYKNLPIIAVSANTSEAEVNEYFGNGISDFIPKPIEPSEILTCIKKYENIGSKTKDRTFNEEWYKSQ